MLQAGEYGRFTLETGEKGGVLGDVTAEDFGGQCRTAMQVGDAVDVRKGALNPFFNSPVIFGKTSSMSKCSGDSPTISNTITCLVFIIYP